MFVGVAHFFPNPQIQQGKRLPVAREQCLPLSAPKDLQGQEGVEIRAAKGTIQYRSDMQMQLMFNIAGFVLVIITNFRGL